MATYPSNLVTATTFPTRVDSDATALFHKNDHLNANAEVIAIETELGTSPSAGHVTAVDRLRSVQGSYHVGLQRLLTKDSGAATVGMLAESYSLDSVIDADGAFSTSSPYNINVSNERIELSAIFLPAGCIASRGAVWRIVAASGNSDEFSGFGLYSTDGTTLTRRAIATGATNLFSGTTGLVTTGGDYDVAYTVPSPGGLYYCGVLYAKAVAPATAAAFVGRTVRDDTLINLATPSGYPRHITYASKTTMSASLAISGGVLTSTNWMWQSVYGTY